MKQPLHEEFRRMQKLAGIINENKKINPLEPQNDNEKLLSPPKIVKDIYGNDVKLIGQEAIKDSPVLDIGWDENGKRWTRVGKVWNPYRMDRYKMAEFEPELEPQDKVQEKAFDEHIDMLKTFVENVLEIPYDKSSANIGQSVGENNSTIFITSKIYGKNPTLFTTYHNETNGELINYKYTPYVPLKLSSDQVKDILTKIKLK